MTGMRTITVEGILAAAAFISAATRMPTADPIATGPDALDAAATGREALCNGSSRNRPDRDGFRRPRRG
jgi:hypothetical protein